MAEKYSVTLPQSTWKLLFAILDQAESQAKTVRYPCIGHKIIGYVSDDLAQAYVKATKIL